MAYNVRIVSSYHPPRKCGVGVYARNLATALGDFTGEIGSINVAAILGKDEKPWTYSSPVDLKIYQDDPRSWKRTTSTILERAEEKEGPTIAALQIEFGLSADEKGSSFVNMARSFMDGELIVLSYLHTIPKNPEPYERETIQALAEYSDRLVAHTERGIKTLKSSEYGIDESNIEPIPHGIRILNPTEYDRKMIKERYGVGKRILVTTTGIRGPDKGIEYGIRAYAEFLKGCAAKQRKDIIYVIAGGCHENFVKKEGGKYYRKYEEGIDETFEECKLEARRIKHTDQLYELNFDELDVVLLDEFLDEETLVDLYAATNMMILPYLNMEQAISGVFSDTLGSRRVAILTKFDHALEVFGINTEDTVKKGVLGLEDPDAPCILVDPGEESIEQIAKTIDYLVFEGKDGTKRRGRERRLKIERQGFKEGYQMRWHNSAFKMLDCAQYIDMERQTVNGRGIIFEREKPSPFE